MVDVGLALPWQIAETGPTLYARVPFFVAEFPAESVCDYSPGCSDVTGGMSSTPL